ncbi:hypothetical protein OIU34_23680 [Pararhizobium sp. BT-229]|uniref:hypothetical protein n=1 Tax=Pararhizobium sp. BT-229 TaxID=2986923 RepID=UPI0021F7F928|nr:hypothetical protein [Pararhizobium sp. BT-229]MCV9964898.1 hypothetical protein [Pararhizobium sp. BT-229]
MWTILDEDLDRQSVANDLPSLLTHMAALAKSRDVRPCIATIGRSAIASFQKLDHALDSSIGPARWNIQALSRGEPIFAQGQNRYFRKPKVRLDFSFDTFPARRGNLELKATAVEGYENDFAGAGLHEVKLLRIDGIQDYAEELMSGGGVSEGGFHLHQAMSLFEYVVRRVASSCDVELGDRPRLNWHAHGWHLASYELVSREDVAAETQVEKAAAEAKKQEATNERVRQAAEDALRVARDNHEFRTRFEESAGISAAEILSYIQAFKAHNRAYIETILQMLMDSKGLLEVAAKPGFADDLKKAGRAVKLDELFADDISAEELDRLCIASFGTTKGFQKRRHTPIYRGVHQGDATKAGSHPKPGL